MKPGEVIAGRFQLERVQGSGGMGTVFRALDRLTGDPVAIKVMIGGDDPGGRFAREAQVLAELRHPAIVRYVAHGRSPAGEPYLAMEWLDGEDLAGRLARAGLTTGESVTLARRAAEALGAAHARGVIHRDIKPGNLFLPGADVGQCKVLDFGIARRSQASRRATRAGAVIGTPGFMAPEQARGLPDIDARADVFSLGCVLFLCLSGRAPFVADDLIALLAKVVFEDAPRLADVIEGAPPALDDLLARMLAKDRAARPEDGRALADELRALGELGAGGGPVVASPAVLVLTEGEQRLVSIVVAGAAENASDLSVAETLATGIAGEGIPALDQGLDAAARRAGARVERLANGVVVASVSGQGSATELVERAARCALAMRAAMPDAPIVLATGRGVIHARLPVGEVIDRATAMLRAASSAATTLPIQLDELTAGLLGARFAVRIEGGAPVLRQELDLLDSPRLLLGRPSPFVGRERELGALAALFEECAGEPAARVVLITAPAGAGKSRLRQELVRRAQSRAEPATVWIGQGDPMSAGSAFGMLADIVRRAAAIHEGEPLEERRQKLRDRAASLGMEAPDRVARFLGELVGAPFPDTDDVELRAARQDAMLMGDQIRRAWEDLLQAECRAQPVLLVLDDLQWGDLPTVQAIDASLRNLPDMPLLVAALGRPEVDEHFPRLWAERGVERMPLPALGRKASERIVQLALGDRAAPGVGARLAERAAGNAFYLEELIRAVAAGRGEALPDTVLAVVQARLDALDGEARRLLRGASVFGQVFWRGGLGALLGAQHGATEVHDWLGALEAREIFTRRSEPRFAGEQEYAFSHALVREAAYAMLTDEDRTLGHRLAGAWLERTGEHDAVVLAEHFERGRDLERAAAAYRRAAEQAAFGNDLVAAIARANQAIACGADGETLGAIQALKAEAHRWRGELVQAQECAIAAMQRLPRHGASWCQAAAELSVASGKLGDYSQLQAVAAQLRDLAPGAPVSAAQVAACTRTASPLIFLGHYEMANQLIDWIGSVADRLGAQDPAVAGRIQQARAFQASIVGDSARCLRLMEEAAASFEQAGDLRTACGQRANVGFAYITLGVYDRAERALHAALSAAERMGLRQAISATKQNLGMLLLNQGALEQARAVELEALRIFEVHGDKRGVGFAYTSLAMISLATRDFAGAERDARAAIDALAGMAPVRVYALGALAQALTSSGRAPEALAAAREAMGTLDELGGIEEGEAFVRLAYVRALDAAGDHDAARAAVAAARERLLDRAAKISDDAWRASFLTAVHENAETLALADRWLGPHARLRG